jgi:hypothetical protein
MNLVNDDDIVTQALEQQFVPLRNGPLAPDDVAELASSRRRSIPRSTAGYCSRTRRGSSGKKWNSLFQSAHLLLPRAFARKRNERLCANARDGLQRFGGWNSVSGSISWWRCGYKWATLWSMVKTPRKKQPKALKGDVVRMRVTAAQKRALEGAADRAGLELSAWLRQLALRAAGVLPEP